MHPLKYTESDTIISEKYTISWLPNSIFRVQIHENAFLEIEDIHEIQVYKAKLTNNRPYGVLFITPNFGNISKEAKDFLASENGCKNAVVKAVVISNLGVKIIYNSFIRFNKPVVIHRAFSNEKSAHEWLLKHMCSSN